MTRLAKHFRTVKLLSSGAVVKFDPSQWLQMSGAKEFDADNTAILRVFKTRDVERYMIYGSRASGWNPATKRYAVFTEAYEIVAVPEALQSAISAVAKHCGVAVLVTKLVERSNAR